jgi:hypothetical protein
MKRYVLALAAFLALTAGAVTSAKAVEFDVGPNGVYVGPRSHGGYRDYRDYRDYRQSYNRYGDCRVVITHQTNRFGENVTVRRRVCD